MFCVSSHLLCPLILKLRILPHFQDFVLPPMPLSISISFSSSCLLVSVALARLLCFQSYQKWTPPPKSHHNPPPCHHPHHSCLGDNSPCYRSCLKSWFLSSCPSCQTTGSDFLSPPCSSHRSLGHNTPHHNHLLHRRSLWHPPGHSHRHHQRPHHHVHTGHMFYDSLTKLVFYSSDSP